MHHHLSEGDRALQRWIRDSPVTPRLALSDKQFESFLNLAEKAARWPNELLCEAIEDLLEKYRGNKITASS